MYSFPKSVRLRAKKQYRRMIHGTLKHTGRWIVVDLRVTKNPFSRLGIIVTRRYGTATQRNRFKRIVREAFRLNYSHFHLSFDIVVRPRTQALIACMPDVQQELLSFIEQSTNKYKQKNDSDTPEDFSIEPSHNSVPLN